MPSLLTLKEKIHQIWDRIKNAAERSGRSREEIRLVAVTKTVPPSYINEAIELGIKELGESRIQEAIEKRQEIKDGNQKAIIHHFIGSLQTNKVRKAVELFHLIQSVDRPRLAEVLNRVVREMGKIQDCLIEVKISPEPTKRGFQQLEAEAFIKNFRTYSNLRLCGLMTIAPLGLSHGETKNCFRSFYRFFDKQKDFFIDRPILSMGMSDDFEAAIEEGSNMVRIGRGLFGERMGL